MEEEGNTSELMDALDMICSGATDVSDESPPPVEGPQGSEE